MKHFKTFSIYAFTLFFNAALSFAGFSVLTHHLNEVDYGIINLYTSFTVLVTPFIAIGVPFFLSVEYFKKKDEEFKYEFTNAIALPAMACIVFTILFILFYPLLEGRLKANPFFIIAVPFFCFMIVLNDVFLYLFRNKQKQYLFAGYSIGKNILEVGTSLLLVIIAGLAWQGRLASSLISLVIACLALMFFIYKWRLFTGHFNKKLMLSILLAGLPFVPERLAIFVLGYSDRFFIDHFKGTAEVGYYGAGAQVAMIVNLAILSLNNTFYPSLFRNLSAESIAFKTVRKLSLIFIGVSFLLTLMVIASIPILFTYFIGPAFRPGQQFALYLTIGFFFWSIYNVFIAFLLNLKKNKLIMYISIGGMMVSLIANFINIRNYGAIGATYTSMIVYGLMAAVTVLFVHKHYDLRKIFLIG
jgi:O-antigen/teichoic acid export membrane protein